jgi:hypothetical protein
METKLNKAIASIADKEVEVYIHNKMLCGYIVSENKEPVGLFHVTKNNLSKKSSKDKSKQSS